MRERSAAAAAAGRPLRAGAGRVWAWRAHAWGGAAELQLDAVRAPALRRPDHVLVRVRSAALNPLDAAMLRGYGASLLGLRRRLDPVEPASPPLVVGREAAGEIERVGPAVGSRLQPGMRVWLVSHPYAAGTLSEQVCVPAASVGEAPCTLPDEGGALYAGLTAAAALRGAGGARHILLLGAGGVGLAALQLAAAAGAHVTVAANSDQHDLLRELGASDVIDCYAPDYDERLASLPKFDAIIDCAGLGGWEAGTRRWRYSRYVTLTTPLLRWTDARGALAGSLTAAAALAAQNVAAARAAVDPGCAPSVRWAFFSVNEADIERIRRLAEAGRFRVVVERRFGWREVPAAIEHLERGHARGKILIDFNTD